MPTAGFALLVKHGVFVGWHLGHGTLGSMRIAGKLTNDRDETAFRFTTSAIGLVYRTTLTNMRRAATTSDEGFTCNIFWRRNENGLTTPMFGEPAPTCDRTAAQRVSPRAAACNRGRRDSNPQPTSS
jgi:hypothetical protein